MVIFMAKYCEKCKGLLVQGAETCIICGKTVFSESKPAPAPRVNPVITFKSPVPGPQIRFVTAPGGRRIEDTSTTRTYKAR